ncbi:hypothetical protein QBC44DRAFT_306395 [Cladorrhinum sp. PSN332]|nr:hypothetical protein QBC44DRAFT_306395 [Cladorrhinum sp. PSN332]
MFMHSLVQRDRRLWLKFAPTIQAVCVLSVAPGYDITGDLCCLRPASITRIHTRKEFPFKTTSGYVRAKERPAPALSTFPPVFRYQPNNSNDRDDKMTTPPSITTPTTSVQLKHNLCSESLASVTAPQLDAETHVTESAIADRVSPASTRPHTNYNTVRQDTRCCTPPRTPPQTTRHSTPKHISDDSPFLSYSANRQRGESVIFYNHLNKPRVEDDVFKPTHNTRDPDLALLEDRSDELVDSTRCMWPYREYYSPTRPAKIHLEIREDYEMYAECERICFGGFPEPETEGGPEYKGLAQKKMRAGRELTEKDIAKWRRDRDL